MLCTTMPSGNENSLLTFISVKGRQVPLGVEILGTFLWRDVEVMKKVYHAVGGEGNTTNGTLACRDYVMSRLQRASELEQFQADITKLDLKDQITIAV